MANIFKESLDVKEHPNRNNHDLTHKVHGSYKMGILYPFLCKKIVPGDSYRIDTACSFQANAMPFPTQSNVRAIFHYFYVRNKNIWENWGNWLEGLEEHTPPYINRTGEFYATRSLSDYLGVPTTVERDGSLREFYEPPAIRAFNSQRVTVSSPFAFTLGDADGYPEFLDDSRFEDADSATFICSPVISANYIGDMRIIASFNYPNWYRHFPAFLELRCGFFTSVPDLTSPLYLRSNQQSVIRSAAKPDAWATAYNSFGDGDDPSQLYYSRTGDTFSVSIPPAIIRQYADSIVNDSSLRYLVFYIKIPSDSYDTSIYSSQLSWMNSLSANRSVIYLDAPGDIFDLASIPQFSPYYYDGIGTEDYRVISALPYRAYESIYYAYYSNSVMQPLVVNGQKRYNRYNTYLGDGADNTEYHLFHRNWELDAYTSALPSPMQGNMPLVGMNVLGDVTLEDPDSGAITTAHANVEGEDVSIQVTSPIQSVEHGRTLVNLLNTGFSIPDFREANALTRFLEQGLRSGYRYVDWIHGQTGVKPKYNELDMPEFLGGFSTKMNVNKVTNTNGDGETPLGAYAANGSLFGGSKHGITRFFDDYGFIIGIMCLVPDNAYSQILPSEFRMDSRLDNYFPIFSQTNYQPITYEEIAPIQSHYEYLGGQTNKKLTDTFGYQRPNHDLVWYPDTVHGDLRLSLRDIVVNRIFKQRPELSREFLEINDKDASRIFAVTKEDEDNFIGEIVIKISAKRPVPRVFVPSLGK